MGLAIVMTLAAIAFAAGIVGFTWMCLRDAAIVRDKAQLREIRSLVAFGMTTPELLAEIEQIDQRIANRKRIWRLG